jgi:hypothetical protein
MMTMMTLIIAWIALLLALLCGAFLDPGQDTGDLRSIVEFNLWIAHNHVKVPR